MEKDPFGHGALSASGYELPWTGIINAKPSPHNLHALITLGLTRNGNISREFWPA